MKIGVFALQGAFAEHIKSLESCRNDYPDIDIVEVRNSAELEQCDGLIIPGGESTAMRIIADKDDLFASLRAFAASAKPIWGTCAGCIILSDRVSNICGGGRNSSDHHVQTVSASELYGSSSVGGVDISTCRNFFGRQTKSFQSYCQSMVEESAYAFDRFPCIFIRAPAIIHVGENAKALASINHDGEEIVVAAIQGNLLVTCFHPELTSDRRIHQYFLTLVASNVAGDFTRLYIYLSCMDITVLRYPTYSILPELVPLLWQHSVQI